MRKGGIASQLLLLRVIVMNANTLGRGGPSINRSLWLVLGAVVWHADVHHTANTHPAPATSPIPFAALHHTPSHLVSPTIPLLLLPLQMQFQVPLPLPVLLSAQGPGADLEYTIVRPGGLTVNPPTGQINVIDGEAGSIARYSNDSVPMTTVFASYSLLFNPPMRFCRADVASFCLDAILDPEWKYIGKTPCISSLEGTSWTKDRSAAARGA